MNSIVVRLDEFIAPLTSIIIIKGEHNNIWFKVSNMEHQCRIGFVNESCRDAAWDYIWTAIKDVYDTQYCFLDFRSENILAHTDDSEMVDLPA